MTNSEIRNHDDSEIDWTATNLTVSYDPADDCHEIEWGDDTRLGTFSLSNGAVLHEWIKNGDGLERVEMTDSHIYCHESDLFAALSERGFSAEKLQAAVNRYFRKIDTKTGVDFLKDKLSGKTFHETGDHYFGETEDRTVYFDDAAGRWFVVENEDAEDLGTALRLEVEDAYSLWCGETVADEMPSGWTPPEKGLTMFQLDDGGPEYFYYEAKTNREALAKFLVGYDAQINGVAPVTLRWGAPVGICGEVFEVDFRDDGQHRIIRAC